MNRIEILHEMGITPVWVPRRAAPTALETRGKEASAPETLVPATDGDLAAMSGSQSGSAASVAGRLPPSAPSDPERTARIGRMDWPALKQAVASCHACGLCKTRHSTVFGTGDEAADLLIIGEAPGEEEDLQGEPFVGQAGKLLDAMLAALDFTRHQNIYIANTLKCRPPANRHPDANEMAQCAPHLMRQVELVAPKLILLMGRFAVQAILQTDASIASLRGKRHAWRGVPVVVTYHPAYLLRTLTDKAKAWEDLVFARAILSEPVRTADT